MSRAGRHETRDKRHETRTYTYIVHSNDLYVGHRLTHWETVTDVHYLSLRVSRRPSVVSSDSTITLLQRLLMQVQLLVKGASN